MSPPAAGKSTILLLYVMLCVVLLAWEADTSRTTGLDWMGFRSGWIALAQTPLLVLLSTRGPNFLQYLTGIPYGGINWLHHWVGRILVLISLLHAFSFYTEWILAGALWTEWHMMPHIKHGTASMAMLLWIGLSSAGPLRRWSYEMFQLQHKASAFLFLLFLEWHIPPHHKIWVYIALGLLAWSPLATGFSLFAATMIRRLGLRRQALDGACTTPSCRTALSPTYEATLRAAGDDVTLLTLTGVHFPWRPGQHVLLWAPRFWWHSPHPFTIVNAPPPTPTGSSSTACAELHLVVRTKTGFTRCLNRLAAAAACADATTTMRVCITPPTGRPPTLRGFETVVLASASTGASFTLPLLEDLMRPAPETPRHLRVLLVARRWAHVEPYVRRIRQLREEVERQGKSGGSGGPRLDVEVALTGRGETTGEEAREEDEQAGLMAEGREMEEQEEEQEEEEGDEAEKLYLSDDDDDYDNNEQDRVPPPAQSGLASPAGTTPPSPSERDSFEEGAASRSSGSGRDDLDDEDAVWETLLEEEEKIALDEDSAAGGGRAGAFTIRRTAGRPDLEAYLARAAAEAAGRMGIVACGGGAFAGAMRAAHGSMPGAAEAWFHAEAFKS